MKITKATLVKIIKEELGELEFPSINVSEEPPLEHSAPEAVDALHKIKEIVDMAVLDKGLGFRPGSAEQYLKQISSLLGN